MRLEASGEHGSVYELPITQEQIADATGMTPVHTNRTIQALRKEGLISWSDGRGCARLGRAAKYRRFQRTLPSSPCGGSGKK